MDKMIETILVHEAELLAKKRSIAEVGRVIDILKKTALDYNGVRFLKDRDTKDPLEDGLTFAPSFYEALSHLPIDKALSLFETVDIDDLASKVSYFDFLTDSQTPFYTHKELAALIKQFIVYLKANKSSLLAIGYPAKSFENSPWLYENLSRLYPIKIPFSVQDRDLPHQKIKDQSIWAKEGTKLSKTNVIEKLSKLFPENDIVPIQGDPAQDKSYLQRGAIKETNLDGRNNEENLIFNYAWAKECVYPSVEPPDDLTTCPYEEAPLIQGITDKDVTHIENYRSKVLNAKIEILEIANKYLCGEIDKDDFWNECFNVISKELTKEAFRCFEKIEEAYSRLFIVRESEDFRITRPSAITGGQPNLETGGINNILAFIFFIEAELTIGQMNNTKSALLKLTDSHIPSSYYDLVSSPSLAAFDEVIRQSKNDATKTAEFNELFDERLKTDSEKKLKMLLEVPSKNYDTVKRFSDLVDAGPVSFNLESTTSAFVTNNKKITPIELPSGTKWEDITIKFMGDQKVQIKFKGRTISSDYIKIGFEDTRGRRPNKQWELLQLLALRNGELAWEDSPKSKSANIKKTEQDFGYEIDEDTPAAAQNKGFSIIKAPDKTKKTKQLLSQALKAVFPIDGDPFYPYEEVKAYKIRIKLIP